VRYLVAALALAAAGCGAQPDAEEPSQSIITPGKYITIAKLSDAPNMSSGLFYLCHEGRAIYFFENNGTGLAVVPDARECAVDRP
jgi:hypothetical protein